MVLAGQGAVPWGSCWGGVSAGGLGLVPGTGCWVERCLCAQGLEEPWLEGPQPGGEALLNGDVGQDPHERAPLPLLGQLSAVEEELPRAREELQRSKALEEPEERKPLDFLKRRVSPCPTTASRGRSRRWDWPHPLSSPLPAEHSDDAGAGQEPGDGDSGW